MGHIGQTSHICISNDKVASHLQVTSMCSYLSLNCWQTWTISKCILNVNGFTVCNTVYAFVLLPVFLNLFLRVVLRKCGFKFNNWQKPFQKLIRILWQAKGWGQTQFYGIKYITHLFSNSGLLTCDFSHTHF